MLKTCAHQHPKVRAASSRSSLYHHMYVQYNASTHFYSSALNIDTPRYICPVSHRTIKYRISMYIYIYIMRYMCVGAGYLRAASIRTSYTNKTRRTYTVEGLLTRKFYYPHARDI